MQSNPNLALGTWTANGVQLVSTSVMKNNFTTMTYLVATAVKPRQFMRLKVDKP